ncbi:choline ABC transporter substrate-binding protein [Pelagibacterium nitratireducens]|jgi:glycine betaine/proline transport system substrate-binding protein|uniref:Choline ABC transporter substrate-binding protein n=1 Tax=Pelagibacterium nitratireducens TaxID=1046114 RepID=A0ABZ2HX81_9HYPH|tara:strand:+ start:6005 stop:6934 length:930 start_codon:yes stop_codon:yes gene_type:complete
MIKHAATLTSALALSLVSSAAFAQAQCTSVSFSDVGWTDITTTTSATKQVLEALGYDVNVRVLSVPVTFASLESDDVDVFLGNWMPSQQAAIQPYLDSGEIESVSANLEGTKYNLAVPTYTYEKGLQTYDDIADFAEELDSTIYGIEPGNEANTYLVGLIEEGAHGLGDFEVRESSEQGMLLEVGRAVERDEDIVFLGWEPHPMNSNFDMSYVEGGEEFFGGEGNVYTVTRTGFVEECPNLGTFLENLSFTLPMENQIMGMILDEGMDPDAATMEWMQNNPDLALSWLDGVTTVDGGDAEAAVREALDL